MLSLLNACATPPSPPPPAAAVAVAALVAPADGSEVRRPPPLTKNQPGLSADYYPPADKRAANTGRVLVEFGIGADGMATAPHVVQADAAPGLQAGALELVRHLKFDVTAQAYDPANPTPYGMLVTFCMNRCVARSPFPAQEFVVTGHINR